MRKLVVAVCVVAFLAVPALASAATYNATITLDLNPQYNQVHTYNVTADCTAGTYTGTGSDTMGLSGGEVVSGTISAGSFTGHSVYNNEAGGQPYSWDFSMTSTDDGASYIGTGVDQPWGETFAPTGTLDVSNKVTACSTRVAPAVTSKDQCKKDGWKSVSRANDTPFKNQGDCVSYVETGN